MITKLYLEYFRGIQKADLDLGRITILTGPNNSGKSSIIYGLLALKNVVLNSNQSLDSFLNLGFLNLGGFVQTVYSKNDKFIMRLGVGVSRDGAESEYFASLGKKKSKLSLKTFKPDQVALNLDVTFPYPGNQNASCKARGPYGTANITWNGISPTINVVPTSELGTGEILIGAEASDDSRRHEQSLMDANALEPLTESLNAPVEELRAVNFIPLKRGFTKPSYSSVPMQPQLLNEDELATLLATDRDLEGKVAHYLGKIVDRAFSVRPTIGTANFNLQTRDASTGLVCDLVNEGFGTNQLVSILTKALRKDVNTVCIEEAEIHLHPGLMDRLVDALLNITTDEDKSFIVSTHNEHIVLSLLNRVAQGKLKPEDIRIYYLTKKGRRTLIEKQEVNEKGQIEGGLKGFYEAELEQVKRFFSIPQGT